MKKYVLVLLALTVCLTAIVYWRSSSQSRATQSETMEAKWKRESQQIVSQSQDVLIHALFTNEITCGTSIDVANSLSQPVAVESCGRYTIYDFDPPGYSWRRLIADGDEIVSASAGSCVWDWTFFDDIPQKDRTAIGRILALRKYQVRFPDMQESLRPKINDLLRALE